MTSDLPSADQTSTPDLHPPGHDRFWRVQKMEPGEGPVEPSALAGQGVRVFHDGAPEALRMWPVAGGIGFTLGEFGGSYLSLALALPDEMMAGLSSRHVLRLMLRGSGSVPNLRARINLRCGLNVSRMLRALNPQGTHRVTEHDLWHLPFDAALLREGWIDILMDPLREGRFAIVDITLSRRWRAEV
ncbi:MAG: hypothetical protein FJX19_07650 [Alphaproteobacteria bacterium]|nr:hypothetical protein [Alphaproteobacteria bacterium]